MNETERRVQNLETNTPEQNAAGLEILNTWTDFSTPRRFPSPSNLRRRKLTKF